MNATDVAVFTKLTGASALTTLLSGGTASVFNWVGPQNTDPPYVIFNVQSPSVPVRTLTGVAYENLIYSVRGVTVGPTTAAAGTIATQINVALDDKALSITGFTLMYLRRVQDIDFPEIVAGQQYHHRGATYRILAR